MILVIGREPDDIYFSKFYLLDDNFKLLHQLNDTKYNGSCLVSGKFLDRIWIQNRSTAAVSYSISINQIDVDNNLLMKNQIYWESEYEVEGVFNTFKVINASTNPKLAVYNKGKSDFWFTVLLILAMLIVHVGSIILSSPIFPYFLGLLIILLFLLFLYRKQIVKKFRAVTEKYLKSRKRGPS